MANSGKTTNRGTAPKEQKTGSSTTSTRTYSDHNGGGYGKPNK